MLPEQTAAVHLRRFELDRLQRFEQHGLVGGHDRLVECRLEAALHALPEKFRLVVERIGS